MRDQELILHFTDREQADVDAMARWFKGIGIAILAIGILAVILPYIATLGVQIMLAVILLLSGTLHLAHAFTVRKWRNMTWELLPALLFLITGFLFVAFPLSGAFALTFLLGFFFFILGIFKIQSALAWRQRPGWGWMLTNGILSISLGGIVILGLPETALWIIGLILGIDLIFTGITLVSLGRTMKSLTR